MASYRWEIWDPDSDHFKNAFVSDTEARRLYEQARSLLSQTRSPP